MKPTWISAAFTSLAFILMVPSAQAQSAATDASSKTLSRILSGEGKPGDSFTTKSGISYRVLSNGTVETRNLRYGTVKYSWPEPVWTRNLKNQSGGRD